MSEPALCNNCGNAMESPTLEDGTPRQRCRKCSPGRKQVDELPTTNKGKIDLDEALKLQDAGWSLAKLAGKYGVSRAWVSKCLNTYRARRAGEQRRFG